ncbi:MAG: tryptophan-rich sensory protein [Halioglobus sp.]|nr:tryptophan-rich sensory protein [Halioglobus sp.]
MRPKSKRSSMLGLVGWLLVCFAASALGAIASVQAGSFYAQLFKPAWAPPSSLFGPVWTVLYAMMAVAAWLVWRRGGFRRNRMALILFLLQLVFNALWSWFFFAWQRGDFAFADIVILWVLIVFTIASFWRAQPVAGALLVPYFLWVSFAAVLNAAIWQLNPQVLG